MVAEAPHGGEEEGDRKGFSVDIVFPPRFKKA